VWRGPYRAVFQALAQRDKAEKAATVQAEKDAVERGKKLLKQAQEAWSKKNYAAAGELAQLASAELKPVLDGSLKPTEDPVETLRKADAALREAKVVLQICERDKCDERDFAEFTRAKEMIKSADESYQGKNYAYAGELARAAKDKLTEILAKPRANVPQPTIDPVQKQAAEDALNEAEIARKVCEARKCAEIDLEAWLRAQQSQAGAKSAVADGQHDRATRLAKQAKQAYEAIKRAEPSKPTFAVPSDIATVTRSGAQLYLKPPVDFPSGSANLAGASREVVADLARVLVANKDVLERVRVLGYTDNRGNPAINRNISAKRAEAVRKALEQAGVPKAILSSEGRGAADPIADNGTPEGQQANRRVEIHFETKQ
jgi:outer membrane protein OmpA-like peptidoglycan-associated protein